MQALRVVVLLAALFTPATVLGATIVDLTFSTVPQTETISFGLDPFHWSGPLGFAGLASGSGIAFDQGAISLTSGPLLSLTIDDVSNRTIYTYGPGSLVISASWGALQGTFTATTGAFSIHVCEGCDPLFGGSLADDFVVGLGQGFFDDVFALMLGVQPRTSGGFVDFGLEAITGGPSSQTRQAFDHRGSAVATVPVSVPEPSVLALSVSAMAWGIVGAYRRRRAGGRATPNSLNHSRF